MVLMKEQLEKERIRLASLYAQFDLSIASFKRETEEERRRLLESQSHYETLRQQIEKDRRQMLSEIQMERKMLEQQHDELLERKMSVANELHVERNALSKERMEAALVRERQNRDETVLLTSLRAKEEEYSSRLANIENDRIIASDLKRESIRLREEAAAEREALRRERHMFEMEKEDLLRRMEEIKTRAEEASENQDRLTKELAQQRMRVDYTTGGRSPPAVSVSQLQLDLAKQRAILNRISEARSI
jgi:hypothetical protein